MRSNSGRSTLRLCIVAPSLRNLGGQSVQAARLATRLRELPGLDVRFLPIDPKLPGAFSALQRIRYVRTLVTTIAYFWSLLTTIRDCDVVHVFSASYLSYLLAPLPALVVGRLFGKSVVLNYHSGEAEDHLRRWRFSRASMRLATIIVVPSTYLHDVFARAGLRTQVIFNFVETDQLRYRQRGGSSASFFTNRHLEELYNVANVLRAFALIQSRRLDARLVIAGDGSQRRQLEQLASELKLCNTEFVGKVDTAAMADLYDQAEILLNGSNIDNMPVSIIEAFACGLPIVSTAAGGIPTVIDDGETGVLVPLNDPSALANAALMLLGDSQRAAAMSARARDVCLDRYVWPAVRDHWRRLYATLIVSRNRYAAVDSATTTMAAVQDASRMEKVT